MGLRGPPLFLYHCPMRRDTPIDWTAIKTAYITGDESQGQLAARFGVSRSRLSDICRIEGWVQARSDYRAGAVQAAVRKASRAQANKLAKIVEASDLLDDVLTALLNRLAQDGLDTISMNGTPGRELESISRAILNNDELKRRLNGMMLPRDAERLKLDREKWEAEQRRMDADKASESNVVVRFADGMEDYAQ